MYDITSYGLTNYRVYRNVPKDRDPSQLDTIRICGPNLHQPLMEIDQAQTHEEQSN